MHSYVIPREKCQVMTPKERITALAEIRAAKGLAPKVPYPPRKSRRFRTSAPPTDVPTPKNTMISYAEVNHHQLRPLIPSDKSLLATAFQLPRPKLLLLQTLKTTLSPSMDDSIVALALPRFPITFPTMRLHLCSVHSSMVAPTEAWLVTMSAFSPNPHSTRPTSLALVTVSFKTFLSPPLLALYRHTRYSPLAFSINAPTTERDIPYIPLRNFALSAHSFMKPRAVMADSNDLLHRTDTTFPSPIVPVYRTWTCVHLPTWKSTHYRMSFSPVMMHGIPAAWIMNNLSRIFFLTLLPTPAIRTLASMTLVNTRATSKKISIYSSTNVALNGRSRMIARTSLVYSNVASTSARSPRLLPTLKLYVLISDGSQSNASKRPFRPLLNSLALPLAIHSASPTSPAGLPPTLIGGTRMLPLTPSSLIHRHTMMASSDTLGAPWHRSMLANVAPNLLPTV
jgi:hypothetical protein